MTALDTNVLIYACDKTDAARQRKALEVIEGALDGVLLWQVACEFIAASRKLAPQGFTSGQAWRRLSEYLDLFPLVLPSRDILTRAEALQADGWSFWDALLAGACLEAGVSRLYSEDVPGRRLPQVEILNPFA